jgi:hypothetical protein
VEENFIRGYINGYTTQSDCCATRPPSTHALRALAHAKHTTSPPSHTLNTQPPPPRACTAQHSPIYAARSLLASTLLLFRFHLIRFVVQLLCRKEFGEPALAARTGGVACSAQVTQTAEPNTSTHTHTHTHTSTYHTEQHPSAQAWCRAACTCCCWCSSSSPRAS